MCTYLQSYTAVRFIGSEILLKSKSLKYMYKDIRSLINLSQANSVICANNPILSNYYCKYQLAIETLQCQSYYGFLDIKFTSLINLSAPETLF